MNLFQQAKAMLTPHGQIQMSYDRFKNTFGELGVAKWRAFTMDNAYLPDGTYNGITKKTVNSVYGIYKTTAGVSGNLLAKNSGIIMPESNSSIWQYGFSNWKIGAWNSKDFSKPEINMTSSDGITNVIAPDCTGITTYNAYLAKHPVVLYYYDSSVYSGSIVSTMDELAAITDPIDVQGMNIADITADDLPRAIVWKK